VPEFLKRGLAQSESVTREVKDTVSDILSSVQAEGESAVRRFSERFDKWSPARFTVDRSEVEKARASVDDELAEHIEKAREQVGRFAQRQLETMLELEVETLPGVVLGHRHVPVEAVGSYSPGGVYPLIASSIMTVTTPKVAGVDRVVATAPPRDAQGIFLPQLYTIDRCGADQVLCLGGVQP
jgi:sulfopropanediol 3-dehydrogenase